MPNPDGKWGVVVFPGSNCDKDALEAVRLQTGQEGVEVWHGTTEWNDLIGAILPGGFSYGDYLRSGAIARFAPVMENLTAFAAHNGTVLGICNGFQMLTESGLLPGVLMRNNCLRFVCKNVYLKVERADTRFTRHYTQGGVVRIPIAHNEGNYFLPPVELEELETNQQVVFRYCDRQGNVTPESNPNGSLNNIAGVINKEGNILGMMPHPERRCDPLLGRPDGAPMFRSMSAFSHEC